MKAEDARIFLCHASEDKSKVVEVYDALKAAGYKPWLDKKDLLAGQYWNEEIPKAIKASSFMLIFFSTTSVAKRGYVQKEFKVALDTANEIPDNQIFLIPVRLDDCQIPQKFSHIHYVDLFEKDGFGLVIKALEFGMKSLGITQEFSYQESKESQQKKKHTIAKHSSQTSKAPYSTAKIAAWNLAGFGGIPDSRLESQIYGLALLDAEVVALVEINPLSALEKLRQGLEDKGLSYKTVILPQNNDLHLGVLFKSGISMENPLLITGTDIGNTNLQRAFLIDMRIENFDFTLIVIHLKAGLDQESNHIRDKQAKVIAQFIKDRLDESRKDILMVGDFNMIPGQDTSNYYHLGGDFMNFLSSWDLREDFSYITEAGRVRLSDGFAIRKTIAGNYIRESLRVFQMHRMIDVGLERFRETVSHHLPFVASFRTDLNLY